MLWYTQFDKLHLFALHTGLKMVGQQAVQMQPLVWCSICVCHLLFSQRHDKWRELRTMHVLHTFQHSGNKAASVGPRLLSVTSWKASFRHYPARIQVPHIYTDNLGWPTCCNFSSIVYILLILEDVSIAFLITVKMNFSTYQNVI
jgi:hypothetical protein